MNRHLLVALAASLTALSAQDPPPNSAHGEASQAHMAAMGNGRRSWSTTDGPVSGSIWAISDGTVQLKLEDGKRRDVAIKALSGMDRTALTSWKMANAAPDDFGKPDVTLTLETLQGQMKYDQEELIVAPGAKVRLVLHNVDDMHHNLIVCTPGAGNGMEVAKAAWALGGDGFAKQWIPEHPSVLAASPMVDPHSTRHLYFVAPSEEGEHPYVCTLPGHAAFMKGILKVQDRPQVLSELTYTLYHGDFDRLPDFDKLTPVGTDHVPSGLIDLSVAKRTERFALVFDGLLNVAKEGNYRFDMASDDGSRLTIDDKVVIDADGVHGAQPKRGKMKLTQGSHRIRVSYFERSGEEALYLFWTGPGIKNQALSKDAPKRHNNRAATGIPLVASNGEARLYRNFIEGAGNRAIGVGYPNGINLAFDADKMRVARVWLGGFIDAARHWNGRGQGHQPPLGYGDYKGPEAVPFTELASPNDPWPEAKERAEGYTFKGYILMKEGRWPMMTYQYGDIQVVDYLNADGNAKDNNARISRSLILRANPLAPPTTLHFLAARGSTIESLGDNRFLLDNGMVMTLTASANAHIRPTNDGGGKELILPITFQDTGAGMATIQQSFQYQLTAE